MFPRITTLAVVALLLSGSTALAQCGCGSSPAYTSVSPGYVSTYAPQTTYYTPAPYVANYAPAATYYAPEPYVTNYAPATAYYAPTPYVSYYAPATPYVTYYSPAATYAPAVVPYRTYYYGVPGWSAYGTPRVYVPGEPVRNVLRAVTP